MRPAIIPIPNLTKTLQEKKTMANISYEYRCENQQNQIQQCIKRIVQHDQVVFNLTYAKLVQCLKIN